MKKIYNLFLCSIIIFLVSRASHNVQNSSKKPVSGIDTIAKSLGGSDKPLTTDQKIALGIVGTAAVGYGGYKYYQKRKDAKEPYTKAAKELSKKHESEKNDLNAKHAKELDDFDTKYSKSWEELQVKQWSEEMNLQRQFTDEKTKLQSQSSDRNDIDSVFDKQDLDTLMKKFKNDTKKMEDEYALKRKNLFERRQNLLNKQQEEKRDLAKEQDAEIKAKVKDSVSSKPANDSSKELVLLNQAVEESDTDKQAAQKTLNASKAIKEDNLQEKNNKSDDENEAIEGE